MTPTSDFLHQAEKVIRHTLDKLRPQLLEAQGNIKHQIKSDKTVVTEMDVLVEHSLREALTAFDPGISFNLGGHEWDFAPGALLVQEAGGLVRNIGSDSYDYRNFNHIAANPVIFDDLMQFMTEFATFHNKKAV